MINKTLNKKERLSITNSLCELRKDKQFRYTSGISRVAPFGRLSCKHLSLEFRIQQSISNDNHAILDSWKCHHTWFEISENISK